MGTYGTGIGCDTHEVFDVPLSVFPVAAQRLIPDTIASNPEGTVLRLYVPRGQQGQITEAGLINGAYAAPRHPFVPRGWPGRGAVYTAPADAAKYRSRAPARTALAVTDAG